MDMIDILLARFNEKKNIVDSHSEDCSLAIKPFCKIMLEKYNHEKSKLIDMMNADGNFHKIFAKNYDKFGLYIGGSMGTVTALGLTESYMKSIHLDVVSLPKSGLEKSIYDLNVINWDSDDVDYWIKVKKHCDFRIKELKYITMRVKQTIEYAIELQDKRADEICKSLRDISGDVERIPRIEIRIVTE